MTAKPLGSDLGTREDLEMGSDLEAGTDKRRAGDSLVAASVAMFEPFSGRKRDGLMRSALESKE